MIQTTARAELVPSGAERNRAVVANLWQMTERLEETETKKAPTLMSWGLFSLRGGRDSKPIRPERGHNKNSVFPVLY